MKVIEKYSPQYIKKVFSEHEKTKKSLSKIQTQIRSLVYKEVNTSNQREYICPISFDLARVIKSETTQETQVAYLDKLERLLTKEEAIYSELHILEKQINNIFLYQAKSTVKR